MLMAPKRGDGKRKSVWPAIKPKTDLKITPLKDTHLFTVQNFFTAAESKAFIETTESIGFVHQGSLGPTKGEAFRDNDRISLEDPVLAVTIWESGLKRLFADIKIRGKVAVGLNPNIRFYRQVQDGSDSAPINSSRPSLGRVLWRKGPKLIFFSPFYCCKKMFEAFKLHLA